MNNPQPSLAEVLKDQPQFHRLSDIHSGLDAALTSWAARLDTLEYMRSHLQSGMHTLETGCGYSTVMFALSGTEHYCVTPAQGEAERVREFCESKGIDTSNLHFLIGNSQDELVKLPPDLEFDLAFIDGGHFFPIPCIDWYYADLHLKKDGIFVLDDLRIPTVRMVYDFMRRDHHWEEIHLIDDTVYFRKVSAEENLHDWIEQKYNQSYPDYSFLPLGKRMQHRRRHFTGRARATLKRLLGRKSAQG